MRRILYGLAVLLAVAATSLVWAQPAQAAPAQCTVSEWRTNFKDCSDRARQGMGEFLGCIGAPIPGSPTSGMAGWFSSGPPASAMRSGVPGMYSDYGLGGYGLDTYNLGCLDTVKHPDLTLWNNAASFEFGFAASIMGAANALRERAYDPGAMWGWSDKFIELSTDAVYNYIFSYFGGLTLAGAGLYLLWRSRQGNMSEALRITAWAVLVMVLVTAVARWPVQAARGTDAAGTATLSFIHRVTGGGPKDVPLDQCVLGQDVPGYPGTGTPEACIDHRSTAVRASDTATEAVLYRSWLRAVLGSADSDTANKYGPALYDATTLRWEEAARIADNPDLRDGLIEGKAQQWNTTAELIRAEDPQAYEHLQGIHGMDRFGSGGVALVSAASFSFFDMLASLVIMLAFLILRIAIILLPLLGTLGVFLHASSAMRRLFHAAFAAIANIAVFGVGSGLYNLIVDLAFHSALPGYGQVIAVAAFGVVFFLLLIRPIRHQYHTVTGRSRGEETLLTRSIRGGREILDSTTQPAGVTEQTDMDDDDAGLPTSRPENTAPPPRRSTKRILTETVAPTVATLSGHPEVAGAITAVNKFLGRPENTSKPAGGGRVRAGTATIDGTATETTAPVSAAPAARPTRRARPESGRRP